LLIGRCFWTGSTLWNEREIWILWWSTVHSTRKVKNSIPKGLNISKHKYLQYFSFAGCKNYCFMVWQWNLKIKMYIQKCLIKLIIFMNSYLCLIFCSMRYPSFCTNWKQVCKNFTSSECLYSCIAIGVLNAVSISLFNMCHHCQTGFLQCFTKKGHAFGIGI
jgi:hypothetical protein